MTGCEETLPTAGEVKFSAKAVSPPSTTKTISWYEKFNWKAEDFFDNPKVIALCKAIEAKDLKSIDRLVADGADVNAKGTDNMTPLLWAFPEDKPEVFKRILEHGADPNVEVTSDFNTKKSAVLPVVLPGDSVLHLAAQTSFSNYFKYVMQHGGNPNLIRGNNWKDSPLITVIRGGGADKKEAILLLTDAGADLEYAASPIRGTALWECMSRDPDLAFQLLSAGASAHYCKKSGDTLAHCLLRENERGYPGQTPQMRVQLIKLNTKILELLEAYGADLEGARRDNAIKGKLPLERIAELKKRYEVDLAAKRAAKEKKERGKDDGQNE